MNSYACTAAEITALRQAAWTRFMHDYSNAVDADPGDARARYLAEIRRIETMRQRP